MSYKDFNKDCRKNMFHNVVVLYGPENLLIRWALEEICDKYAGKEFRTENIREFDGDEVSLDEIMGMARTPSMFPGQRVLIIRNHPWMIMGGNKLKEEEKELQKTEGKRFLEFAAGTNPDGLIVMVVDAKYAGNIVAFGKKVLDKASAYEMNTLSRPELIGFIGKRVKGAGKTMNKRELEYLIEMTGYYNKDSVYRLDNLDNDLNKIITSAEGEEITREHIDDLIAGDADKFIFHLIDAMVIGDRKKAITITEHALAEDDNQTGKPFQIIGTLTSQFELMYDAQVMEEKGISMNAMVEALGVNKYRFQNAYKAARHFDHARLKELLIRLYNCDRDVKNGNLDARAALETFLLLDH